MSRRAAELLFRPETPVPADKSGAFVEEFEIPPRGVAGGPLSGVRLAVKDVIDLAGRVTGYGSPDWAKSHPPAVAHAVCVEPHLDAGATIVGKTHTDELAFSLIGENAHYGVPLNPLAPDRLPGGSSGGSASAVACHLADLALGTDTGGSVRGPASNCGLFGLRPTHGRVPSAGVLPLAPSLDTVGWLARDIAPLRAAVEAVLGDDGPAYGVRFVLVREAWDGADPEVAAALAPALSALAEAHPGAVGELSLSDIAAGLTLPEAADLYRLIQGCESYSCLGPWLESARPTLGATVANVIHTWKDRNRAGLGDALRRRTAVTRALHATLMAERVLVLPTTPTLAPLRAAPPARDASPTGYYTRSLGFLSVAGLARLPQLTLPLGNAGGVPVGLSLVGGWGTDGTLVRTAEAWLA